MTSSFLDSYTTELLAAGLGGRSLGIPFKVNPRVGILRLFMANRALQFKAARWPCNPTRRETIENNEYAIPWYRWCIFSPSSVNVD